MQTKTIMKHHLTQVRMAIIKNLQVINAREGVKKREPSCSDEGNVNWSCYYGKQYRGSLKKLKIDLSYDPVIPLLGTNSKRYMHLKAHSSTTYNNQDMEAT